MNKKIKKAISIMIALVMLLTISDGSFVYADENNKAELNAKLTIQERL